MLEADDQIGVTIVSRSCEASLKESLETGASISALGKELARAADAAAAVEPVADDLTRDDGTGLFEIKAVSPLADALVDEAGQPCGDERQQGITGPLGKDSLPYLNKPAPWARCT